MVVMWKITSVWCVAVASAWCMVEDQWWKENDRRAKIGGHRRVSDVEAHHPLPTEIMTVLSHHMIR